MKAAYVCSDRGVPIFGSKGCSLHVQEITKAFEALGIQIRLVAAALGGKCPKELKHVDTHHVKHTKTEDRQEREQYYILDNQKVIDELHKLGQLDFVYERYSLWSHAGMTFAKEHHIPSILEVNAPLVEEQKKYRGLIDEQSAIQVTQQCFSAASLILTVSNEVADYVDSFAEARGKIQVLPNGVNIERFSQIHSGKVPEHSSFTIGFVGTLKPWHGVERLLESFATLNHTYPTTRLLIVGDGPMRDKLQSRIHQLKLEDVVDMTGAVAPSDIAKYFDKMDVGVAPYPGDIHFYFSPLKIYEYMAAGLPVVASNVGKISDLVNDHHHGLIYAANDVSQLTEALSYLVENPDIARRYGQSGRRCAIQHHSWQSRVKLVLDWSGITIR
ncbi:glycosyltransferase family 4 protein [uncultured Vibrio sp.]|uniref:glycosyltransferase family 4 protein n=1 Tax=uncultured Vibrio sp. TaxID=114054 RepID=UPI0009237DEC|nr:glycosyltransferase family 4 protein [uncultured Vibrio sp.]OIQ25857.1 MAG: glycosyl transferase family 1 [Vibrio sp. MedPE-SWchi]